MASWIDTNWQQDDNQNGGYPYPIGTTPPVALDTTAIATPWKFSPYINGGYPYVVPINVRYPVPLPDIHPPVSVYKPNENEFDHNGMRILWATSCTSDESDDGWEVQLTHPIDPDGDWTALQVNNILKVPLTRRGRPHPQLFRIYRAVTGMTSNGAMQRVVYARHIFYDLNDVLLEDVRPTNQPGSAAIQYILKGFFMVPGVNVGAKFEAYSDIEDISTAYYQGISVTAALIGEDNCFLNRWGGALYRDNHYFSICKQREDSRENAFAIEYSVDMTEIQEDIDYTDYVSYLIAEDNFGHRTELIHFDPAVSRPHHVVRHVNFNYDSEADAAIAFYRDAQSYFDTINTPKAAYRIAFAKLTDTSLYADFIGLQELEVGDTGTIYNRVLDILTTQRVVRKRVDVLTDSVLDTEMGNLPDSLTRKKPYSNTISKQSAISKQLTATQSQLDTLSVEMIVTHPIATTDGKWLTTSAGKFIMWKGGT